MAKSISSAQEGWGSRRDAGSRLLPRIPVMSPMAGPATSHTTPLLPWSEWVYSRAWGEHADAIPMLPALAHEIAEIALDPEVPAIRIAAVVSKDPVLATSVIQLANSAARASAPE